VRHGYDPPPLAVHEQRQPSRVSAYLSSLLGDDYKYPVLPEKTASFSEDLHEEFDAGPDDLPELDESSDDEDSPTEPRLAASANLKASEAERPINEPDRYIEIPAVTFTRPGALGPGHPPYGLLLSLPPELGKNRIVMFDVGYYDRRLGVSKAATSASSLGLTIVHRTCTTSPFALAVVSESSACLHACLSVCFRVLSLLTPTCHRDWQSQLES
jgi:hypothetical protein